MQIHFFRSRNQNTEEIWYDINIFNENIEYDATSEIFEIMDNTIPFSEWNECNIKFPSYTTKNWVFRFEGKNISTNISVLYDTLNASENILVFWDSVSNIKYNFTKRIIQSI